MYGVKLHHQGQPEGGEENMETSPTTLSVDEAHALIGRENISRGGFYAAINRNEVPNIRLGKRILIPRHAFFSWL